jgi:hypothetical protein
MSNLLGKSRFDSPLHVYLTTIKRLCCPRLESKKRRFLMWLAYFLSHATPNGRCGT